MDRLLYNYRSIVSAMVTFVYTLFHILVAFLAFCWCWLKSNAVVTCEIKLFQPLSRSVWNNFAWNYFRIISQAYCSSWIFFIMFIHCRWNDFRTHSATEIILLQFRTLSHVTTDSGYVWNKKHLIWKLFQNNFVSHVTTAWVKLTEILIIPVWGNNSV